MLVGGEKYLLDHLPDETRPNIYYVYYGTQVMHNMSGYEWDTWNRRTRDLLLRTQVLDDTCAGGSWDPAKDTWGKQGGRVMETSLSTLRLEIYYQWYLFRVDTMGSEETGKRASESGTNPKEKDAKEPKKEEPEKFDKVDIGKMQDAPPAELEVDPTLENPAQRAQEAEYNDSLPLEQRRQHGRQLEGQSGRRQP